MSASRTELALTGVLVAASLLVAAIVVRREFFPRPVAAGRPVLLGAPPAILQNWEDARTAGMRVGPGGAPITIVELGDLECPACRSFHRTLNSVMSERGEQIEYVFVHFPLPNHRFAEPAARALDCAHERDSMMRMLDAVYAKQDSIGLRSWASFASEAGIRDSMAIAACAVEPDSARRIESGRAFANRIGAQFTPTILINGWRLSSTPDRAELDRIITALLSGAEPFDVP